jgi:hypothetical protein
MPAEPPIKRTISSILTFPCQEIRNSSQGVISAGLKHAPNVFAFMEQSMAMLSSAPKIPKAIGYKITATEAY